MYRRWLLCVWLGVAGGVAGCTGPPSRFAAQACPPTPAAPAATEAPAVLVSQPGQELQTPGAPATLGADEATEPTTAGPPREVPIGRTAEGEAAKERAARGEVENTTKPSARPRGEQEASPEAGCTN